MPTMKTKIAIALGVCLLAGTACTPEEEPDPIIGFWRSTDSVGGERNELEIDAGLVGTATIYFYIGESLFYADFTAVAFAIQDRRYEIEMICDGGCSELNFEMECVMIDERNLRCEGDGAFSSYQSLSFRRY
jgi:hypothetical protein